MIFALAGKSGSQYFRVLLRRDFRSILPIEPERGEDFLRTSTIFDQLAQWQKTQNNGLIPVLCVNEPLVHTFRDKTIGNVCGVFNLQRSCIITTYNYHPYNTNEDRALIQLSITVVHEIGHDLYLCPKDRPDTVYEEKYGSHCAHKRCAMYLHDTDEQVAYWKKGQPFCHYCLSDLSHYFSPPADSLADTG